VSYVCCILARYCIRWGRIYIDFDSIKRALKADALQIVNTVKKPAAAGAFEYDDSLANEVPDGLPNIGQAFVFVWLKIPMACLSITNSRL
jgi:hypothetical protein